MSHVSIELAGQLKKAGLEWVPKRGDFFATCYDPELANVYVISGETEMSPELGGKMWFYGGDLCNRDGGCRLNETFCYCMNMDGFKPEWLKVFSVASAREKLWLPSFDRLRMEIGRRGYWWGNVSEGKVSIMREDLREAFSLPPRGFKASTTEDAFGLALLWILVKKKNVPQKEVNS